jgi:hypothetical protein
MYQIFEHINGIDELCHSRSNDFSEPLDIYLNIASQLEATGKNNYITRAKFIRQQCEGDLSKELFDKCREDWGIWNFDEDILTVDDFKRGFLWKFRDRTTSWNDNQKAKTWFLTSPEGLFVRRYEFWTWDNQKDECINIKEGSCKEILRSLLREGDYEVLSSLLFSRDDLGNFIKNYSAIDGHYTIEEIIEEYIKANPNYALR